MIDQTDTSIEVRETVDAPAAALFAVLTRPAGHAAIDGSGMVRGDVDHDPIDEVGQVFTMDMHYEPLGDYQTANTVLEFERDRVISWTTARVPNPPAGVVWSWHFADLADGRTEVTHRYDWSGVTDPAVLARVSFPRVSAEAMSDSVRRLVSVATRF